MKLKSIFFLSPLLISFSFSALAKPPDCTKFINPEDVAFADQYLGWLSGSDFDKAIEFLDPNMKPQMIPLKDSFQKALTEVKAFEKIMIGCNVNYFKGTGGSKRNVNLSYEWSSPTAWYEGNLAWQEIGNTKTVYGLHISPLTAPLEKIHAFSLSHKGIGHWFFLLVCIVNPILILWALIACIRTKIPKRKWLWILFIIVGFFQFTMEWTSGELSGFIYKSADGFKINPISFQLFGSGFNRATDYSPWLVTISLPLGALIFLPRRKKFENKINPKIASTLSASGNPSKV
jgi:hypothetical protein